MTLKTYTQTTHTHFSHVVNLSIQVQEIDRIIDGRKRRARGRRWNGAAKRLSASVGQDLNKLSLSLPPGEGGGEEVDIDIGDQDYDEDSYFDDRYN